ncbi:MAG: helix-turn-helix transcriptional regulator [Lachnospiraceae bacterium]|nr:helix-turn-helix transcriptional regulator [Lachnospiraceae bacterium]
MGQNNKNGKTGKKSINDFSANLQALRKERNITQEQLASHLGVSAQAVSKWENGKYPESDIIPAIADFFDVSIDFLYGREKRTISFEQTLHDKIQDICKKESENKMPGGTELSQFVRNIHWASMTAPWANNKEFCNPPCDGLDDPKMASVYIDDRSYSYMGLRRDNDFYVWLNDPGDFDAFENVVNNADPLCELFALLGDKEKFSVMAFLYSLGHDEFVSARLIASSMKISVEKVEEVMEEIFRLIGHFSYGGNSPFHRITMVDEEQEEHYYGTDQNYGGLFMALLMIARDYVDTPCGFNMMISHRREKWLKREKIVKKEKK